MRKFNLSRIAENATRRKPQLLVLIGVEGQELPEYVEHLFTLKGNENVFLLEDRKPELLLEATSHVLDKESIYWCTFEEYLLLEEVLRTLYEINCLRNNLYYNKYPYRHNLEDIAIIYQTMFNQDDRQLSDEEQQQFEIITKYYGDIYYVQQNDHYYITYVAPKYDFHAVYDLYAVEELEDIPKLENQLDTGEAYQFELSENEDNFFLFVEDVKESRITLSIVKVLYANDFHNIPYDYVNRLKIIQQLAGSAFTIYLATKQLNTKKIERAEEYRAILKKYWGYKDFKLLKMYKNIELNSRETIEVSQAQIIDDIVEQAEHALKEESFRDVYITSATGSGKSVMFQIPALYLTETYTDLKPLTIVVSPLIGLMNDQVKSMQKKSITNVATIHSNLSPVEKNKVISDIQEGKIDIIYLSPETLLSRSEISVLIGERKIGLFIIDEAHIVTTWGKSFRADYWYLGTYIAKLRKTNYFPIVTFTATAVFGGQDDMYLETRNSLNMLNPISYFGYVVRDDIRMHVENFEKAKEANSRDYLKTKFAITAKRLLTFIEQGDKVLVYFPTVKTLRSFHKHMRDTHAEAAEKIGTYYGSLDKAYKEDSYTKFLSGEYSVMLATKAFGMGIDIPDIAHVYHYAPTGDVVDYIQEIGRAARSEGLVGRAWFDYLSNDFSDVNRLHGMSAMRKEELIEVMRKINQVYEEKKSRNLVVSADDFQYIFSNRAEEMDVDNKVKIALLMIEKDFVKKLGFSPFVARPRQLFGNELIFLSKKGRKLLDSSKFKKHFKKVINLPSEYYEGVYEVELKDIWEKYYDKISYPQFKYYMYSEKEKLGSPLFAELSGGMAIQMNLNTNMSQFNTEITRLLNSFEEFLRLQAMRETYFSEHDLTAFIKKKYGRQYDSRIMSIVSSLMNGLLQFNEISRVNVLSERKNHLASDYYSFKVNNNYDIFFNKCFAHLNALFDPNQNFAKLEEGEGVYTVYLPKMKENEKEEMYKILLGLGESLGESTFTVLSGGNPQIYVRINSMYQVEKAINSPAKYTNTLLQASYNKHKLSVELLKYLFTLPKRGETAKEQIDHYTQEFWKIVEGYFLGEIPDAVMAKLSQKTYASSAK